MQPDPSKNPSTPEDDIRPDATVELSLDDAEALDLQAFADEVAESAELENPHFSPEMEGALDGARSRIEELERLDQEHQDKHRRLLADFANFRNRTAREIQLEVERSEKKLLLEILPVMDSFERCLSASYPDLEAFSAGVALIQKQFQDALRRLGVERAPVSIGDPFDASHAEALTTMANPDLPDGCVATVYEPGYTLRESLLRPAKVVVNNLDGHGTEPASDSVN